MSNDIAFWAGIAIIVFVLIRLVVLHILKHIVSRAYMWIIIDAHKSGVPMDVIADYTTLLEKHGPDSELATHFKRKNNHIVGFNKFAESVDKFVKELNRS